jgi:hypothetical protein
VASGIDPELVKEVVEELQQEEHEIRERLRKLDSTDQASRALASIKRLREHADDIRRVLTAGDAQDQRKIFTRTVRSVTWLRNEESAELRLTLPEPEKREGVWTMCVPGVGFEPTWPLGQGLLRAPCLTGSTTRAHRQHRRPRGRGGSCG